MFSRRHFLRRGTLAASALLLPIPMVATSARALEPASDGVLAPDGWDHAWQAALRSEQPAFLVGVGDSYMHGGVASDWVNRSWWGLLRARLLESLGLYGDFFGISESRFGAQLWKGQAPWEVLETEHAQLGLIGYSRGIGWTGAAGPLATFTTPYPCGRVDLLYQNPYAARGESWTFSVDGGPTETVALPAPSTRYPLRRVIDDLDPAEAHSVTILGQSADNAAVVYGAAAIADPSAGVGFAKCAMQGAAAADYTDDRVTQPVKRYTLFQGLREDSDTGFGFPAGAALAIIAHGVNDCQLDRGAQAFATDVQKLISAFRTATPDAAILLIVNNNPPPDGSRTTFRNAEQWPGYVQALRGLASANGAALVDFQQRWGSEGVGLGFQSLSEPHPTDAGHADMAAVIANLVLPG